jgi:hypothetical protein
VAAPLYASLVITAVDGEEWLRGTAVTTASA